MARSLEEQQALNRAVGQYTGKQVDLNAIDPAFQNSDISLADRIQQVINSPEALQYAQSQAASQFTPQISQVDQATAQTKSDMDTLIAQLQKQQQDAPESIFNDFNRRGLFRSSASQKAVADTVGNLTRQLGNAQIQRSTRLADLAAQRASLLNQQTQTAHGIIGGYLSDFQKQQAAEAQRQYEMQLQQMKLQAALARANGSGGYNLPPGLQQQTAPAQQQPSPYDPNEDLFSLTGSQPQAEAQQNDPVGNYFNNWLAQEKQALQNNKNFLGNVQTPSFLKGIFGNKLFARG